MPTNIRAATINDTDALLHLYFQIYGNEYPMALGTDKKIMTEIIQDPDNLWLVAEDEKNRIVACTVFEVDALFRIARAEGMVTLPEMRGSGIARHLLQRGSEELLEKRKSVNSIYATTRTVHKGPQLVVMREGYLPLGIFPNAHKLAAFETLTLMAKFAPGVLDRRVEVNEIPAALEKLCGLVYSQIGVNSKPKLIAPEKIPAQGEQLDFEIIFAPKYVSNAFQERFKNPYDRFYPFHEPNILMASTNGEVEIFAYFSKDGYCTIVALTVPSWKLAGRLHGLFHQLRTFGVSYIEILMGIQHTKSLHALLGAQFLPSALYPAMYEQNGKCHDMVLMSRSMEPLDFRGMEIERSFKPYFEQYLELWKKMYLDTLEIFNGQE